MIPKFVRTLVFLLLAPALLCRGGESLVNTKASQESLPIPGDIHKYKAPLYWTIYEYAREWELAGVPYDQMDLSSKQWDAVIEMMATKFKPYGYNMICTDGFLPQQARDGSVYMTHYGSMPLRELIRRAKAKGLKVGVYDNPLWIKGNLDSKVPGTDYTLRSLTRNADDVVMYPEVTDRPDFTWLVTDHPGAREYIDGWFKHYHDMGVDFVRMDFMCWYEDGDPGRDYPVTCGYGRERYERGLAYICESATKYGIFTSIVMPELYNDAELESKYCNMMRVVQDTNIGGWHHFSSFNRGTIYDRWPYADNQCDGFTHWSHIGGRGKIILDGDFLRLNKCSNDDERRSQVSLQLMAGGPVAIADTPETIGNLDGFYTNTELLALNSDGFVGKPISDVVNSDGSCIWYGTMSNGDVVLAMFNREDYQREMSVNLQDLGVYTPCGVRDLWAHADESGVSGWFSANIPAHGCKVVKLTPETIAVPENLYMMGPASPTGWYPTGSMTKETLADGRVMFSYSGVLYNGTLRFVDSTDWGTNMEYGAQAEGWHLKNAGSRPLKIGADLDKYNFFVHGDNDESDTGYHGNGRGSWTIKIYFGKTVSITAEREENKIPEQLYIVGDGTPARWNVETAVGMTKESEGVFTYRGNLYPGRIRFIDGQSWNSVAYIPKDGSKAADSSNLPAVMDYGRHADRYDFSIAEAGEYELRVTFADNGDVAKFESISRVGDMEPQVYAMGHASGSWDSEWPNASGYLTSKENVFVWEGSLTPSLENGTGEDLRKHFKFIEYPKAYDDGCVFYVPADVDHNGNVKTVHPGDKLPVKRAVNGDGSNIDSFWGFPMEACVPFRKYRVTLDLNAMTIEFAGGDETYIPEHLYMVGPASPSLWNIEPAQEMVNEGNGVFSYRGNLYNGELQFLDVKNWDTAIRYVPLIGNTDILQAGEAKILQEVNSDRKWMVPEYGEWEVKVRFIDGGHTVSVSASRVGDMLPQAISLGHATDTWDCQWPQPSAYLEQKGGETNVFVWEGTLTPDSEGGSGNDLRRHFKFIAYPKAWDNGCVFYVPADVDHNGNVKTVHPGDKLPVKRAVNGDGSNLDSFWGFAAGDCTPYNRYRVTLNLNDMTVLFERCAPDNLYMIGNSCPTGWEISNSRAMSRETSDDGTVTFSYYGVLYNGELRFIDGRDWSTNIEYGPEIGGWHLKNAGTSPLMVESDLTYNNFFVHGDNDESGSEHRGNGRGTWSVKVSFPHDSNDVRAEAVREANAIPERLYIVGDGTPALWNVDGAIEMTKEGYGVFTYRGNLYPGRIRFIDGQSWDNVAYIPATAQYTFPAVMDYGRHAERYDFNVAGYGQYDIRVTFTANGDIATVEKFERIGDMAPQVYTLGHATGIWDSRWPHPSGYLTPKEGESNVFVWEGAITPHYDNGTEKRQHFKFIREPKDWNGGCVFYVPTEKDAALTNARTVKAGDKLPVAEVTSETAKPGQLDWFWGFPAEACTPDKKYKVTLNLNDHTIEFAEAKNANTGNPGIGTEGFRAVFIGNDLVIDAASSIICVYDITGRRLAVSDSGTLVVPSLPKGIYVVKTADAVVKVSR